MQVLLEKKKNEKKNNSKGHLQTTVWWKLKGPQLERACGPCASPSMDHFHGWFSLIQRQPTNLHLTIIRLLLWHDSVQFLNQNRPKCNTSILPISHVYNCNFNKSFEVMVHVCLSVFFLFFNHVCLYVSNLITLYTCTTYSLSKGKTKIRNNIKDTTIKQSHKNKEEYSCRDSRLDGHRPRHNCANFRSCYLYE